MPIVVIKDGSTKPGIYIQVDLVFAKMIKSSGPNVEFSSIFHPYQYLIFENEKSKNSFGIS